ncbi:glutamate receptor ionotropic, kainate glr-3-like [Hyalella azteca]|uniref:Glutamate receptor ionotropic, kainate glr-3-like n=1 Tax=Hyalella azteca TaxID=294128 RepID=A0A8B7NVG3_HYAAZ|nr:glutamate receptor ionotropic, kainate glr-3-like [Hyalella azteca]
MDPYNRFGSKLPNGTWTGIIGMLVEQKAAFSLSPIAVSLSRYQAIDFSGYADVDEHAVLYAYPQLEPDVAGFLRPFSFPVWMVVFSSILVTSLALAAHEYLRRKLKLGPHKKDQRGNLLSQLMVTVRVLLSQTQDLNARKAQSSILLVMWLWASFVLTCVYKSNLMSMLVAPVVNIPFTNFEQLVNQKKIPYKLPAASIFVEASHNSAPETLLGKLWRRSAGTAADPVEVFGAVMRNEYAFITFRIPILATMDKRFVEHKRCMLTVAPGTLLGVSQAWGFPKNSPWKAPIDKALRGLNEFGIINKLLKDTYAKSTLCVNPVKTERTMNRMRSLGLEDFLGVFALFGAGSLMAMVVFMAEVIVGRCHTTATSKKRMQKFDSKENDASNVVSNDGRSSF